MLSDATGSSNPLNTWHSSDSWSPGRDATGRQGSPKKGKGLGGADRTLLPSVRKVPPTFITSYKNESTTSTVEESTHSRTAVKNIPQDNGAKSGSKDAAKERKPEKETEREVKSAVGNGGSEIHNCEAPGSVASSSGEADESRTLSTGSMDKSSNSNIHTTPNQKGHKPAKQEADEPSERYTTPLSEQSTGRSQQYTSPSSQLSSATSPSSVEQARPSARSSSALSGASERSSASSPLSTSIRKEDGRMSNQEEERAPDKSPSAGDDVSTIPDEVVEGEDSGRETPVWLR